MQLESFTSVGTGGCRQASGEALATSRCDTRGLELASPTPSGSDHCLCPPFASLWTQEEATAVALRDVQS